MPAPRGDVELRDLIVEATPVWFASAACRGMDPDEFHPGPNEPARRRHSLAICNGAEATLTDPEVPACPVRAECLDHALAANYEAGIWGGATERERRRIRRSLRSQVK